MLISESDLKTELEMLLEKLENYLADVRTGIAKPDQFLRIKVQVKYEGYEGISDIRSLARVSNDGPMSILIYPFDNRKEQRDAIIKGIVDANLGYSPSDEGDKIRINIPALTGEIRSSIVKKVNEDLENTFRKSLREIRQDYMGSVNKLEGVSEDEQELTRKFIQAQVDETLVHMNKLGKEKELEVMKL